MPTMVSRVGAVGLKVGHAAKGIVFRPFASMAPSPPAMRPMKVPSTLKVGISPASRMPSRPPRPPRDKTHDRPRGPVPRRGQWPARCRGRGREPLPPLGGRIRPWRPRWRTASCPAGRARRRTVRWGTGGVARAAGEGRCIPALFSTSPEVPDERGGGVLSSNRPPFRVVGKA